MYTVLIVDDEIHAIRGLQAGVRWEELNIHSVLTARSMKQAQAIFQTESIQLMICDIEMPKGSGMDLLAWLREYYPKTETVFLTSHPNFSYAKKAIQLGSFDYLLKPVDYEELEQVIGKALAKVNKEREQSAFEANYKHFVQLWESQQPLMKERFWQELLRQSIASSPERVEEQAAKYKLPYLVSTKFLPVYIRVQSWHKSYNQRDEQIMEYALRNAAEEHIANLHPEAAVVSPQNGKLLVLIPVTSEKSDIAILADCEAYVRFCSQYFNCDLCAYIGQPAPAHRIVDLYLQLSRMDEDNVTQANQTLLLRDYRKKEQMIELPSMSEWAEYMKKGAKDKLVAEVIRYLDDWKDKRSGVDAQTLQLFYQNFLQMMFFVLQLKELRANEVFASNLLTNKPEAVLCSVTSMKEWILYLLEVAMNRIHALEENMTVVEQVKRFISEHMGEQNLTRDDVASSVYLNPDYLNRVFKKETGKSISDYVQQQRIEHAKKLLMRSEYSVSDIALQSGYSNLSYFSTLFKKMTGMNPGDYRKLSQSK